MSHHFDYPTDETLDITDAFCFAGAGDLIDDVLAPRTVFGMNTSPLEGQPWNPDGYYELKIDTNHDYVEDITFRATFPIGADGLQYVQVEQLTGRAATDRTARGTIITPRHAPVGEVVECRGGIKLFAGTRLDPFYNFIPFPVATAEALAAGTFPDFDALRPATDSFANSTVRSFVLEVPVKLTGRRPVNFWGTTAYFDKGHRTWVQLQRAAAPNMTTFFDFAGGSAKVANYNSTAPTIDLVGRPRHPATDPAKGIWGQVRDNIAAVVEAGGTYGDPPHKFPTALAYGAWAADKLLPNVITFTPGTVALWDPWFDSENGKGIVEDIASNVIKMIVNQDFSSGLKPAPILDYFPYLATPPAG
ncbi:DUF4331 family protein [Kribbella jiaozuonensis]|uniref:DUF4331 domain-containing protein n=1 Tax=Kribbella jiaozuonensis TaxID=2575441 RepID=A0A4U3LVG3_9ACTN|nr:DUF4331 family protein [Kribbella jiaozuonensis]TKK80148.1 DUF4331 domain-containing protein [Kribbella jiaozuonensis]